MNPLVDPQIDVLRQQRDEVAVGLLKQQLQLIESQFRDAVAQQVMTPTQKEAERIRRRIRDLGKEPCA